MVNPEIDSDGNTTWRDANGNYHRDVGPAVEYANGYKEWWHHGELHRAEGPAREYAHGTNEWWHHGELHRAEGPAVEYANRYKEWWHHGLIHRTDGPAVVRTNGYKAWYLNHTQLTFDKWLDKVDISDEDKVMMMLKYG
jgi:hypothetical protein